MLTNAQVVAVLPCVDLERARDFYGNTLGLKEMDLGEVTAAMDPGGAAYVCGKDSMLFIYARPTPTTADHTAAGFLVKDVDATADALISRGIKLEVYDLPGVEFDARGVATMGSQKSAWFKDPEGNILSIVQMP